MTKTTVMLVGLALFAGASLACFGLVDRIRGDGTKVEESCEGLEGQAKIDCEQRDGAPQR
jgi:hypothetical protein